MLKVASTGMETQDAHEDILVIGQVGHSLDILDVGMLHQTTAAGHPKKRVTFNYFILPLLVLIFRFEQKRAPSVTVEIEKGPFAIFDLRPNTTNLQRFIVPWLIAKYGLSYPKTMETHVLKEMLIAIIDQNKLLGPYDSCAEQSKIYAVAFQDLAKKVKNAAGLSFIMLCCTSASS